jgi:hypothetical protein
VEGATKKKQIVNNTLEYLRFNFSGATHVHFYWFLIKLTIEIQFFPAGTKVSMDFSGASRTTY